MTTCVKNFGTEEQEMRKSDREWQAHPAQSEPVQDPIRSSDEFEAAEAQAIADAGRQELLDDGFPESFATHYRDRAIEQLTKSTSW